jgi:two-component system, LytTR family, sensor histidine kinase AlgZ
MHPILARAQRLAAYLAAWLVGAVLLAAVLTRQGLPWLAALALLLPICLVYAFVCLSAWYVCRAAPLTTSSAMRVLASSAMAAIVASGLWLLLARTWMSALGAATTLGPTPEQYGRHEPLLFASGVLLFLLALTVHYLLLAFELAREAERRQLQLEVLSRDAELRALRAQLDPHFLYNSLNSISALTAVDPAGARRMCVLLADFLRDTLAISVRDRIPLADELALTDRFLGIEQVRFGERLQVERHVDAAATRCHVPPLVLQPLVENAVTHGIAGLIDGGVIRLDVARQRDRLSIAIENPRDADSSTPTRRGVGLDNVRQRLTTMFGADARLETRTDAERFRVEVAIPCFTDD